MRHVDYVYPNLAAEMARANIKVTDVADALDMHVTGVYAMLKGTRSFPMGKAKVLRDKLFPKMTLDYLFAPDPVQPTVTT